MSTKRFSPNKGSLLANQIEIEITGQDVGESEYYPKPEGVDPYIIEHLEELLEKTDLPDLGHTPDPVKADGTAAIFKRIAEIERKLKTYEAESSALRQLLMRLH